MKRLLLPILLYFTRLLVVRMVYVQVKNKNDELRNSFSFLSILLHFHTSRGRRLYYSQTVFHTEGKRERSNKKSIRPDTDIERRGWWWRVVCHGCHRDHIHLFSNASSYFKSLKHYVVCIRERHTTAPHRIR